ncbi:MAG: hypothetical protein MRY79_00060 [Alphaproteobacteria bacterium]|nr:hypothetical protein [Alphaproteobacteria bacterium]
MSKNQEIYIHIGVGKTGTTTLQNNVFAQLPDVACLGRPNHLDQTYKDFMYGVRLAEDFEVKEYTQPFVQRVLESSAQKVIISDEALAFDVSSHVARRLKELFHVIQVMNIFSRERRLIAG